MAYISVSGGVTYICIPNRNDTSLASTYIVKTVINIQISLSEFSYTPNFGLMFFSYADLPMLNIHTGAVVLGAVLQILHKLYQIDNLTRIYINWHTKYTPIFESM